MEFFSILVFCTLLYTIYIIKGANEVDLGIIELFNIRPIVAYLKKIIIKKQFLLKNCLLLSALIFFTCKTAGQYAIYQTQKTYRSINDWYTDRNEKEAFFLEMKQDLKKTLSNTEAEKIEYYTGLPICTINELKAMSKPKEAEEWSKHIIPMASVGLVGILILILSCTK